MGNTKAHDYSDDAPLMRKGRLGEEAFLRTFSHRYEDVQDVRKDKAFQIRGVDFVCMKDDKEILVDVKSDSYVHRSNNIPFELAAIRPSGPKWGWGPKTDASVIVFYSSVAKKFYTVRMEDFRAAAFTALASGEGRVVSTATSKMREQMMISILVPLHTVRHRVFEERGGQAKEVDSGI